MYRTNKIIKLGRIKTSRVELIDITKAWFVLSLAFAFVFSGVRLFSGTLNNIFSFEFLILFLISAFTAGLGFLLHESMRIDPNDSDCDINVPGAYSSANCYHCVYVVKIVDHSKDPQFSKSFSSFKLEKEVVKKMQRNLQNYFIIR